MYDRVSKHNGFELAHTVDGTQGLVHVYHDPGARIALQHGQLDLRAST